MKIEAVPIFLLLLVLGTALGSTVFLSSIVRTAYATPYPIFGPVDHTYNLTIANQTYPIKWGTLGNGTIETMQANYTSKAIRVTINDNKTDGGGLFFIELPRDVIDATSTNQIGNCNPYYGHDIVYNISVTPVSGKPEPHPPGYYTPGGYDGGGEECGDSTRTLSIYYPPGENVILIQGTLMVPEFASSLSTLVITLGIVGAVGASIAVKRRME